MARNVREIINALPRAQRARVKARAAELLAEEMTLQQLRRARKLSQVRLAEELGIGQDGVSRIEKRADLMISTLRRTVEAMGGELSLIARFPDGGAVELQGFAGESFAVPSERRSTHADTASRRRASERSNSAK